VRIFEGVATQQKGKRALLKQALKCKARVGLQSPCGIVPAQICPMQIYAPLNSEPLPCVQQIEVATFFQLPTFQIIGLPAPEVAEAKERVRSAIQASDLQFPRNKIILNLSPASIRKQGTGLDLAMALGILSHQNERRDLKIAAWGELSLGGLIKPCGQLTRSIFATWAAGIKTIVIAQADYERAIRAVEIIAQSQRLTGPPPRLVPVDCLAMAWKIIEQEDFTTPKLQGTPSYCFQDKASVISQKAPSKAQIKKTTLLPLAASLERALCIASAGFHHILLLGPKGTGKSQAMEWLIELQHPISLLDQLHHCLLAELRAPLSYSFPSETETDDSEKTSSICHRISPHVRPSALLGQIQQGHLQPGVLSLAHGRVLIADELPEWPRDSREALREPLERGKITLTRANQNIELPARFLFAANGNLCPCGGWPEGLLPSRTVKTGNQSGHLPACTCKVSQRQAYLNKISGPILDRIDLISLVLPAPHAPSALHATQAAFTSTEPFESIREKVCRARERLHQRWGKAPGLLSAHEIEDIMKAYLSPHCSTLDLPQSSLRSRHKIARICLTIAAYDGADIPTKANWIEASHLRPEHHLLI
jgi:magnesium chelatase family protein